MNRELVNTVLIDADSLVYAIGFASETYTYVVGSFSFGAKKAALRHAEETSFPLEDIKKEVTVDPLPIVLSTVATSLEEILFNTGCTYYDLYLTEGKTFRDTLVDYYKANRDPNNKPFYYTEIREYLKTEWGAEFGDNVEADDLCGIYQDTSSIISSIDKDLDTIPGWHYNPNKKIEYYLSEVDALRNLYGQMLTGDAADNIPGLFKITKCKCRAKYLEPLLSMDTEEDMYKYIQSIYLKCAETKGIDKDFNIKEKLEEIKTLLTILQEPLDVWQDTGVHTNTVDTNLEVSSS